MDGGVQFAWIGTNCVVGAEVDGTTSVTFKARSFREEPAMKCECSEKTISKFIEKREYNF